LFYEGWSPSRVPQRYDRAGYLARFAREARVHDAEAARAVGIVTAVVRRDASAGVVAARVRMLPADLRELLGSVAARKAAGAGR
jgi:uncharacterized protein (DUF2267 family)